MAIKLTDELGEAKWINMSSYIATIMRERKNLNANDFYSATVYYSLGFQLTYLPDLYIPYGWLDSTGARATTDNRLYRPLTKYVGPDSTVPVPALAIR